ncbi:NADH dehydrogenase [ubiquinone] 1 alphasubcomplex subunit 3 [Striga asiatica]|uniref:NADH dehydrogenase [ubiquinone] 1 alphasubcomplex subunit 3 n=1 Tax=Striga asiatica TaxID=4170 RepID=A0A5A7PG95_STRAF|nr:NADH dehydrogenase [ubiquinone] 1 alphasubcomplex subunit 3 [Striga asiatica]
MDTEQDRPTIQVKNKEDETQNQKNSFGIPPHEMGHAAHNPSPGESEMMSPPIQTMGQAQAQAQPSGYDPNRIPASIFSSKPTNPGEWSVASNESLFSIHMGNNSFSHDYAILYGKSADLQESQLRMSGELPRLDDWNNNNNNKLQLKSSELIGLSPVMEEGRVSLDERGKKPMAESGGVRMEIHDEKRDNGTTSNATLLKNENGKQVPVQVISVTTTAAAERMPSNPQTPRFSDGSRNNSGSSFAFPVLVNDHGKPESLKVVPEKPEPPASQAEDSKETPNASRTRWFSFGLCWPRCC